MKKKSSHPKYIRKILHRKNPYTMIDRALTEDSRLSFKALGLLVYLLSRPADWHIYMKQLVLTHKDGMRSIQSAMQELKRSKYADLLVVMNNDGSWGGKQWVVAEHPSLIKSKDTDNAVLALSQNVSIAKQHCVVQTQDRTKEGSHKRKKLGSVAVATRSTRMEKDYFGEPSRDSFFDYIRERQLDLDDAMGFWNERGRKDDWTADWRPRLLGFCAKLDRDRTREVA